MAIHNIHSFKSVQNLLGTVHCHLWSDRQHRAKGACGPFGMKARVKLCSIWCQEDDQIITFWSWSYSFLNHLTVRNLFWSNQLSWWYLWVLERTVVVDRESWLHFRIKTTFIFPTAAYMLYSIHNMYIIVYNTYIMY